MQSLAIELGRCFRITGLILYLTPIPSVTTYQKGKGWLKFGLGGRIVDGCLASTIKFLPIASTTNVTIT